MQWTPGPEMSSARGGCTAVRVSPRRCLIIGGDNAQDGPMATTEVLDVETMEVENGPSLQTRRNGCAAVLLNEPERVLVLGGNDGNTYLATMEVLASEEAREEER